MSLITWSQRLSVDVSQCDQQHKKLIGMINELHDAMKAGKANNILGDIFASMIEYTKTHFLDEEKLLQAHGYPELSSQKRSHDQFIQDLDGHYKDYITGKMVTLTVMSFLKKWLEHHIEVDDKKYGAFINSKGVY